MSKEKKIKAGGARKGAGRPKNEIEKLSLYLTLPKETITLLKEGVARLNMLSKDRDKKAPVIYLSDIVDRSILDFMKTNKVL